jgi:hypothetical protein
MIGNWIPSGANEEVRLTNRLRNTVQQLQFATSELLIIHNIMAQMAPGTDYSDIETYFQLIVGTGHSVHDIVGTASDALQASDVQALIQRLG